MSSLDHVREINTSVVKSRPLVAVFAGGTSGIGEYALRALVNHHGKDGPGLRLYVVGRNQSSADKIIADCNTICPTGEFHFIQADLSLLKEVDRCCAEIKKIEGPGHNDGRADFLCMSHADLHFGARRETPEGIDKSLSLLYYSRMRLISNLLPLLSSSNHRATVISIYAAGLEKNLPHWHPTDLSLRNSKNYGIGSYRTHATVLTTFFFETIARENENMSLVHMFPSLVITPAFYSGSHPWWFKVAWAVLGPVLKRFVAVGSEEIGERVLYLMMSGRFAARNGEGAAGDVLGRVEIAKSTDGVRGGGAYSVNYKGEVNDLEETYRVLREDGFAEKAMEHTNGVFRAVDRGEVFTG